MSYSLGGGGGKSPLDKDNPNFALSKPYDLSGLTEDTLDQINEMFDLLFKAVTKTSEDVTRFTVGGTQINNIRTTLNNARVKTLSSGPFTILPAPGNGLSILPLWAVYRNMQVVGYDTSRSLEIRYVNAGTSGANLFHGITALSNIPDDRIYYDTLNFVGGDTPANESVNSALMLRTAGDLSLGSDANTLTVDLYYTIIKGF